MDDRYDPNLILAYVEDELDDAQRADFEATIEGDASLRQLVEQLAQDRVALRALPVESPTSSPAEAATALLERDLLLGDATAEQIGPGTVLASPEKQHHLFRAIAYLSVAALLAVTGAVVISNLTGTPLLDRASDLADAQTDGTPWDAEISDDFASSESTTESQPSVAMRTSPEVQDGSRKDQLTDLASATPSADNSTDTQARDAGPVTRTPGAAETQKPVASRPPAAVPTSETVDANATMSVDDRAFLDGLDQASASKQTDTAARQPAMADALGRGVAMADETPAVSYRSHESTTADTNLASVYLADYRSFQTTRTLGLAVNSTAPRETQNQLAAWVVSNGGAVVKTRSQPVLAVVDEPKPDDKPIARRSRAASRLFSRVEDSGTTDTTTGPASSQIELLVPSDKLDAFFKQLPAVSRDDLASERKTIQADTNAKNTDNRAVELMGRRAATATREQDGARSARRNEVAEESENSVAAEPKNRFNDIFEQAATRQATPKQPLESRDAGREASQSLAGSDVVEEQSVARGFAPASIDADSDNEPGRSATVASKFFYGGLPLRPGQSPELSPNWSAGYWLVHTAPPPPTSQVRIILDLIPATGESNLSDETP